MSGLTRYMTDANRRPREFKLKKQKGKKTKNTHERTDSHTLGFSQAVAKIHINTRCNTLINTSHRSNTNKTATGRCVWPTSHLGRVSTIISTLISWPVSSFGPQTSFDFPSLVTDTPSSIYGFSWWPLAQVVRIDIQAPHFKAWGEHSCNKNSSFFPSWVVIQHRVAMHELTSAATKRQMWGWALSCVDMRSWIMATAKPQKNMSTLTF